MLYYEKINYALPYATSDELFYIRELAACYKNKKTIVMLGAGPGHFAVAMFENNFVKHNFFVVDHSSTEYLENNFKNIVTATHPICIIGDSAAVGRGWQEKVDLLIVDADHRFEGVVKDIEAWWPHVADGGFVLFHDYLEREGGFHGTGEWKEGEVAEAVAEALPSDGHCVRKVGISIVYSKRQVKNNGTP